MSSIMLKRKRLKETLRKLTDTLEARAVESQTARTGAAEGTLGVDALTAPATDPGKQLTLIDVCEDQTKTEMENIVIPHGRPRIHTEFTWKVFPNTKAKTRYAKRMKTRGLV